MALYFSDSAPGLRHNKQNITGNLLINTSYLLRLAKQDKGKWLRDHHIQWPSEPWAQINDIETQRNKIWYKWYFCCHRSVLHSL